MSNVPSLGCKISLISKSEIRYEGILYTLDAKESTVALAKVRSYGTEGRPTDRPVAPRDEVYEYIIFRVSDIKDLQVLDIPKAHGLPPDPAIVQHSQPVSSHFSSLSLSQPFNALYGLPSFQHFPSQAGYSQMSSLLGSSHYSGISRSNLQSQRKSPTSDAGVQVSGNVDLDQRNREPLKPRNREFNQQPNYQNRRRMPSVNRQQNVRRNVSRRGRSRPSGSQNVEKFENEYDFEQANAEFQELENKLAKTTLEDANATSEPSTDDNPGAYDKEKSFFDDISCEATQRSKGFPRFDWRYERKLNVETFGVSANNAWMRRRRGRGGFRRGYSRGRGVANRTNDAPIQKTVTFDETPAIKEVEIIKIEVQPDPIPVIEVIPEKKSDWPEPPSDPKAEAQWN